MKYSKQKDNNFNSSIMSGSLFLVFIMNNIFASLWIRNLNCRDLSKAVHPSACRFTCQQGVKKQAKWEPFFDAVHVSNSNYSHYTPVPRRDRWCSGCHFKCFNGCKPATGHPKQDWMMLQMNLCSHAMPNSHTCDHRVGWWWRPWSDGRHFRLKNIIGNTRINHQTTDQPQERLQIATSAYFVALNGPGFVWGSRWEDSTYVCHTRKRAHKANK